MYQLVIADDTGETTVLPFVREEFSVGRGEGNAIRLTERNVSRKHARLLLEQGAIYVEDLSSSNGTWVNGDRILGRVPLSAGDAIAIGDYLFSLRTLVDREARSAAVTDREARSAAVTDREARSAAGGLGSLDEPSGPAQRIAEVTRVGPVPAPPVQATVTRAPPGRRQQRRLPLLAIGLGGLGLIVAGGFLAERQSRTPVPTAQATVAKARPAPVAAVAPVPPPVLPVPPAPQVVFHEERPLAQAPLAQRERRRQQASPQEHPRKAAAAAAHGEQVAAAPVRPEQVSPEQGEALLKQAYDLYTNGDYSEAVRLAKQGRDLGAPASRAWRILGNSACNLRDLKLVDEAYRRSDPNARQSLIYVCERSGVTFAGGHFQLGDGQTALR